MVIFDSIFYYKVTPGCRRECYLVVYDKLSKIAHLVATTKKTLAEGLVRLFSDNVSNLYRLFESVILNR